MCVCVWRGVKQWEVKTLRSHALLDLSISWRCGASVQGTGVTSHADTER